ncbi:MAG: NAD-dependent epimerase/dehydratase family protein [bacterium]
MKKILITGSKGFIGKNLYIRLMETKEYQIIEFDLGNTIDELEENIKQADFIVHLAGSNRPKDISEYTEVNFGFTEIILNIIKKNRLTIPVIFSSSTQAELDNPYGKSKLAAEELLINYGIEQKLNFYILRLTNVFGKWCRPNYNSAVSTFCNNIAKDLPIRVDNSESILNLVYIDDVVNKIIELINSNNIHNPNNSIEVLPNYSVTLGDLVSLIKSFKESRNTLLLPDVSDEFVKKLYTTYLSYLDETDFSYKLQTNVDNRGDLTELIKSPKFGQFFISTTKPGITRGNHYHHTKTEKFIVIKGEAEICFRKIINNNNQTSLDFNSRPPIINYIVNGNNITPVDIPPGYTHSIKNIGQEELITLFWASEIFNNEKPDTTFLTVE